MNQQKTILVAPLHWGLGHATRCIPIIRALLHANYNVLLGSDGAALLLLKQEFPELNSIELPSYNIEYSKKGNFLKFHLFQKLPHIRRAIRSEKRMIDKLVEQGGIDGIISDNRLGVRHDQVPSVIVTHQLKVLSGSTTWFSSKAHQKFIKKFDQCWVPDYEGFDNLSGILGHSKIPGLSIRYICPLSRMTAQSLPKKYDIICILSGPEPQRSLLEKKLLEEFQNINKSVLLVQGIVEQAEKRRKAGTVEVVNYLLTYDLQKAINQSEIVVARSGYTTIMDLAVMKKAAFFIPTPGQYEQEYLAKRLASEGIVPSCRQDAFSKEKLAEIKTYSGFHGFNSKNNWQELFGLFERN